MNLKNLNPEQLKAVQETNGPLLILAGAGSGKTKVITTKIAYLIQEKNVNPYEILAFTFTNKAADEMKERVGKLLDMDTKFMWIGTFHSICVRILRRDLTDEVYNKNFTIYDVSDQRALLRQCIKELNLDYKIYSDRYLQERISDLKNKGISVEEFSKYAYSFSEKSVLKAMKLYEKKKRENNAFDFDDLILKTIELLKNNSQVRLYYQERFRYVFVDEYQDTNNPQYQLIKILCDKYKNLSVVGDTDQSIYKWRGADISNILNFERDFKDAKRITLSQNYRSTTSILKSANMVISNNTERIKKDLWSSLGEGEKPKLTIAKNSLEEADIVVENIKKLTDSNVNPKDIAVLFRSNSLSRTIEEALIKNNIEYRLVGGIKFYDRAEIKDLISYLKLVSNPNDNVSFERVVNSPKRGIGATTVEKIANISSENEISMLEVCKMAENFSEKFNMGTQKKMTDFYRMMDNFKIKSEKFKIFDLSNFILENSGYRKTLESENTIESESRLENLEEFLNVAKNYDENTDGNLADFLSGISLLSDTDKTDDSGDFISLMTIHAAKGLEFGYVFVIALEEGVFPTSHAELDEDIEEERRLMYVAITRAKKDLYLSYSKERMRFGNMNVSIPSRFVNELGDTVEVVEPQNKEMFGEVNTRQSFYKNFNFKKFIDYNKIESNKKELADYRVGQRVLHKKWGEGIIMSIENIGKDNKITILFDDFGLKTLMQSYAPLKVIE